jgi:hypothetical protein
MDFSTLSSSDVADVALQRTRHLLRVPLLGRASYTLWSKGISLPLQLEARMRRKRILAGWQVDIESEFEQIAARSPERAFNRAVDIGCGHALIDVFIYRRYGSNITLVDIERTDNKHHEFQHKGAGYASLSAAASLLTANGVPEAAIETINPQSGAPISGLFDLAISLYSCGFHYPLSTYEHLFRDQISPGGVVICDVRKGTGQDEFFEDFSRREIIFEDSKSYRLVATR